METSPNMNDLVRHYLKVPDGSGLRFHVEQRLYFYGKLEDTSIQFYITDTAYLHYRSIDLGGCTLTLTILAYVKIVRT